MTKVYAIQAPAYRDGPRGPWVEKYDLSAAEQFGELIRVLPYGNVPSDPEPTEARLRGVLSGFDYARDYVLLLGDPVATAAAVRLLTRLCPDRPLRLLKWDRHSRAYKPYSLV